MTVKKTGENMIGKGKAGPGRPKGLPNKATTAIKDMIISALDQAHPEGGAAYLVQQSKDNPTAFMGLVGKVLPMQVTGSGEGGEHIHEVVWRVANGRTGD